MYSIRHSVGRKGLNHEQDVRVVQELLNAALVRHPQLAAAGVTALEVTGSADEKTTAAIKKFQEKVLNWSGRAVDATIEPGHRTWKALNGNVSTTSEIKRQATRPAWQGAYAAFRQGDFRDHLGDSTSHSIAGYGCALCSLTMAASCIGARTPSWPESLTPRELTPPLSNEICRKAGAFSGFALVLPKAAAALGMGFEEYGRKTPLASADLRRIEDHLRTGKPVAAHVDYKGDADGDHWILIIAKASSDMFTAIDPAYGTTMSLASDENQTVNNARYAETKDEKRGVLFGWAGNGGSKAQQQYVVVRYALLSPLTCRLG